MVKLNRNKADYFIAKPVASGLSGATRTLAKADGFIEIPECQQFIDEFEELTVKLF